MSINERSGVENKPKTTNKTDNWKKAGIGLIVLSVLLLASGGALVWKNIKQNKEIFGWKDYADTLVGRIGELQDKQYDNGDIENALIFGGSVYEKDLIEAYKAAGPEETTGFERFGTYGPNFLVVDAKIVDSPISPYQTIATIGWSELEPGLLVPTSAHLAYFYRKGKEDNWKWGWGIGGISYTPLCTDIPDDIELKKAFAGYECLDSIDDVLTNNRTTYGKFFGLY